MFCSLLIAINPKELDQKEKIFPFLDHSGYSYTFKAGPKKKHGSLVAYRKETFTEVENRTIEYDLQTMRTQEATNQMPLDEGATRGISFFTKNIGNLVALKRNDTEKDGVIVATTHLFWHPRCVYDSTLTTITLAVDIEVRSP